MLITELEFSIVGNPRPWIDDIQTFRDVDATLCKRTNGRYYLPTSLPPVDAVILFQILIGEGEERCMKFVAVLGGN
jgi:hypothetical protein